MQRIGGEEHAGEAELREQPRHGGNLVRCRRDLLVRQDQRSVAGERAQHVGGGLIIQVVEAAAQRFTVQRDSAPARCADLLLVEALGVAPERGFEIGRIERQEEVAQSVERRGTAETGAEDGVQALAVDVDEGDDTLVRGRSGEHRQDREQQQRGQRVAPTLRAARVVDLVERGEQQRKWHDGDLH
jgi:hypothetical protein